MYHAHRESMLSCTVCVSVNAVFHLIINIISFHSFHLYIQFHCTSKQSKMNSNNHSGVQEEGHKEDGPLVMVLLTYYRYL